MWAIWGCCSKMFIFFMRQFINWWILETKQLQIFDFSYGLKCVNFNHTRFINILQVQPPHVVLMVCLSSFQAGYKCVHCLCILSEKKFIQHYILIDLYVFLLLLAWAAILIWANICDRFPIKINTVPHNIIHLLNSSHSS